MDEARSLTQSLTITPNLASRYDLRLNQDGVRRSAYDLLSYPEIDLDRLKSIWPELGAVDPATREALEIEAQYAVYMDRQKSDIAVMEREEQLLIPAGLDIDGISGLSNELKHKLKQRKPETIAEAQRVDGMTPAALALLIAQIKKFGYRQRAASELSEGQGAA